MAWYQDFSFDTISEYRYIDIDISKTDKYVNLMQAYEQDVNIEQGSMLTQVLKCVKRLTQLTKSYR